MSFGSFSLAQTKVLKKYVKGKVVYDLGAGDLSLSNLMIGLGAKSVVAIDKDIKGMSYDETSKTIGNIEQRKILFDKVKDYPEVALGSWISTYANGIEDIIDRSQVFIYLGKNTDGTACGTAKLFERLLFRDVLAYHPHPRNCMIVYGKHLKLRRRELVGEELAGICQDVVPYRAAEQMMEDMRLPLSLRPNILSLFDSEEGIQ